MNDGITGECLKKWLPLSRCAWSILSCSFPVTPVGDVLQSLVVLSVLQILGAHQARSSTRIDEVIELDLARGAVFARPRGRDWASGI